MENSSAEIKRGERFAFGKNWSRFLDVVDEDRIKEAETSLQMMLGVERLDGLTFLDIGSGSGLFSLAAWRLGAKVHSFDFDTQSVDTTFEMQRRYCNDASLWQVETGSVLDTDYLNRLGQFDIVYSWGVLHHTGNMWQAMENVTSLVAPDGKLFIALYNNQDIISRFWLKVKRIYCSGRIGRLFVITIFFLYFSVMGILSDILHKRNPLQRYTKNHKGRGMSIFHDWIDWLGGYPYETAKPEEVFEFYTQRGFIMQKLITRQSHGCNEFVFCRPASQPGDIS